MRKRGGTIGALWVAAALIAFAAPAAAATAPTTTDVAAAPSHSVSGQIVTFTATVSSTEGAGTPTGTVTFKDGSATLGSADLNESEHAMFPTGSLAVGDHTITASYGGDSGHAASHGSVAFTVDKAATLLTVTVLSPPTSEHFSSVLHLTPVAPGNGTPTGSVTYTEGSTVLATSRFGDPAPSLPLAPGLHRVVVTYGGDQSFLSSSAVVVDGPVGPGYRLVAADGGVFSFGSAPFFGSLGGTPLSAPIVGGATDLSGRGYWMLGRDGGVFSFGNAPFAGTVAPNSVAITAGSLGYVTADETGAILALGAGDTVADSEPGRAGPPTVGLAVSGPNIWTAAADGGVFSRQQTPFFGSMGGVPLQAPVVGIAATPTGNGYWLVAADGGVFAFGDAQFLGSMGGQQLNRPIVGMAGSPTGNGYCLVAADGGVFTFGDADFLGSTGGMNLNQPIVAILPA